MELNYILRPEPRSTASISMPQRKIPVLDLIQFLVRVRQLSALEGDERKNMGLIRNLANKMYRNYIGYNHRGEFRLKGRDEPVFGRSQKDWQEYQERWAAAEGGEVVVALTYLGEGGVMLQGTATVVVDPPEDDGPGRDPGDPVGVPIGTPVDVVLVTRWETSLLRSARELCGRTSARLVGVRAGEQGEGGITGVVDLNIGGRVEVEGASISVVQSLHLTGGAPAVGYVVSLDGVSVYVAGRTALFKDMELIGQEHLLDAALLPIGGRVTMGVADAARAVELLRPRWVVPVLLAGDEVAGAAVEFMYHVGERARTQVMKPGETIGLALAGPGSAGEAAPEDAVTGESGGGD